ncbi:Hypothetical protein PHPALM_20345 [Phytophthora palmivora]|uniref:Uncharacterized protein n=1 Tax=Phytophthora palmivora TaxID=4796 RepID=A0A2P4XF36_9STRA|nr:Hypothetical protein PHPALM_20345 [Phytophthora palmivora]
MEDEVMRQHAHPNAGFHCLYRFYCLGYSRKELACIYRKSIRTIGNWINVCDNTGTYHRADSNAVRKISAVHQQRLCDFYADHTLAYLDEAQDAFIRVHHMRISSSSIPIEFMFGYIKKYFQRHYVESSGRDLLPFAVETFSRFENFSMSDVYEHCGWKVQGHFDPTGSLSKELRQVVRITNSTDIHEDADANLGFFSEANG